MATAKNRSGRLRVWLWLALLIAAALAIAWVIWGEGLRKTGEAGTAYAAHVACSCRFIAGRSLEDCAKDKLEGMELVRLSEDPVAKSVTASIPLVVSDTATYREGYACVLAEWER
ncbi:hypothetical protein P8Q88_08105 [Qipengyuania sp. XHP0207]|uniref:hypothetical protein n=1 Tax=Qipengyuania sp. XHP0207 TaxID=3038078 RepID=UPI00242024A4|nr:hypothetical protein [Qipengyuania sp. XHP0207]MDG5748143.1 hypothetical protein [Qipengyuania sp. XHP0207]